MNTEKYNTLLAKNQAHKVFRQDWKQYYPSAFARAFLPRVAVSQTESLRVYDGAELFAGFQKSEKSSFLLADTERPIQLVSYTYPKDAPVAAKKSSLQMGRNEAGVFMEVNLEDEIEIHLKLGENFKIFLTNYFKEHKKSIHLPTLERTVFETDRQKLRISLQTKHGHYNMMRFVLEIVGVDVELLEFERGLLKLGEYERDLFALGDLEEKECDKFLDMKKYADFIRSLPSGIAKNLDCEIQFYRSEKRAKKPDLSNDDYAGEFGFDRYRENWSGKGEFSLKYFPNIEKISKVYKAPYVCLWPPRELLQASKSLEGIIPLESKSVNSKSGEEEIIFNHLNKVIIWFAISQGESKNQSDKRTQFYYDTGNSALLINGEQKGQLSGDFGRGDSGSVELECTGVINDYAHIVFRENDHNGKLVGMLNVVPNNKIYTTNVNLIDVEIVKGYSNLEQSSKTHPIAKPLQIFCNTRSHNQALIHVTVNPVGQQMKIDEGRLAKVKFDDASERYIDRGIEKSFHDAVWNAYKSLLSKDDSTQARLKKLLDETDTVSIKSIRISKKNLARGIDKLLGRLISTFKKAKGRKVEITYKDDKVKAAIADYRVLAKAYRAALRDEVIKKMKSNPLYSDFRDDKGVKPAIKLMLENMIQQKASGGGATKTSVSTKNDIYMFLYKGIRSFKTSPEVGIPEVGGYTLHGDGFVHIFNVGLDNIKRDELISHELGHAFGLGHPFDEEFQEENIIRKWKIKLENLKESEDIEIEKAKKPKENSSQGSIRLYNSIEKQFSYPKNIVESIIENQNFGNLDSAISALEGFFLKDEWIEGMIQLERNYSPPTVEETKERFREIKELYMKNEKKDLKKILNIKKTETNENFMDYYISRNNFWYWQWIKMHCNKAPLKEHQL